MKKLQFGLLAALFCVVSVAGTVSAEHYGPLHAPGEGGKISAGFGVALDAAEWDAPNGERWEDVQQRQAFAQFGLGLGKGWQLELRGGVSNLAIDDTGFENTQPFAAVNFGGPIFNGETLAIGPFVHGQYTPKFEYGNDELENFWMATAGVKFQLEIESVKLYFGPAYTTGGATFTAPGIDEDIEPSTSLLGFLGMRWTLPANWPTSDSEVYFDLEGRLTNDVSGSAAINFTF